MNPLRARATRPFLRLLSRSAAIPLVGAVAFAGFTNPYLPAFRGSPNSHFGGWESFTVPHGGTNAPDYATTTAIQATVEQLVPGAIITGTGNIYHPGAAPSFRLADTVPGNIHEVVFQVSTQGVELVYGNTRLNYVDGQGQPRSVPYSSYAELARYPGTGIHVESMFTWDLSSLLDPVSSCTITFQGVAEHFALDGVLLDTRWGAAPAGFTSFCHPGVGGVMACPCANPPSAVGRGCNNFGAGSGGAILSGSGLASLSGDTVVLTSSGENNTSLTVILQSPSSSATGLSFGAGVRCLTGPLKRLYSGSASGGTISRPRPTDPTVSVRSAALGDPLAAGNTRYYMAYYRDPLASGPCGVATSTYNATQGGRITWAP